MLSSRARPQSQTSPSAVLQRLERAVRCCQEFRLCFVRCDDPRMLGTIEAIRRDLMHDGLVHRYLTRPAVDGLPPGEGAFIACTFWLADCLTMLGQTKDAIAIFDDLGLREHLSTQRSNGLVAMVNRIRSDARAIAA